MVTLYRGLDYADFYKLVANMDIVVPAFADNGCKTAQPCLYYVATAERFFLPDYEHQASSTVALAVELDVRVPHGTGRMSAYRLHRH